MVAHEQPQLVWGLRFNNSCFAVMRSSSEEGSYLRLVDLLYHSTLGRE